MPRNSSWKSKRNSPGLKSQPGTWVWVRLVRSILISLNQTRSQLLVPVLQLSTRDAEPPCSNARKSPRRRVFLLLCADFIIICELGKYCIAIGKCFQQLYLDKKSFSGQVEDNDNTWLSYMATVGLWPPIICPFTLFSTKKSNLTWWSYLRWTWSSDTTHWRNRLLLCCPRLASHIIPEAEASVLSRSRVAGFPRMHH